MALTEKQIKDNDHIPTDEIIKDINDTQREINQYEAELEALTGNRLENKVAIYMREGKISLRKTFISNLKSILEYRKTTA